MAINLVTMNYHSSLFQLGLPYFSNFHGYWDIEEVADIAGYRARNLVPGSAGPRSSILWSCRQKQKEFGQVPTITAGVLTGAAIPRLVLSSLESGRIGASGPGRRELSSFQLSRGVDMWP